MGANLSGQDILHAYRTRSTRVHLRPLVGTPATESAPELPNNNNQELDGNTGLHHNQMPAATSSHSLDEPTNVLHSSDEPPVVPPLVPEIIIDNNSDHEREIPDDTQDVMEITEGT
mgnify:FL=1